MTPNFNPWGFPDSPLVKTMLFQSRDARGMGSIPGRGTKMPHAPWCCPPSPPKSYITMIIQYVTIKAIILQLKSKKELG